MLVFTNCQIILIQSIKMVPSDTEIGKEQVNVLAYADDIALIGKNEIEIGKILQKWKTLPESRTADRPRKDRMYDSGNEIQFKEKYNRTFQNKKLQI